MSLGMIEPRILVRAATSVLLLALGSLVTVACGAQRTTADAADLHSSAPAHHALPVTRHGAERAVVRVARSMPGLHPGLTRCPGVASCHDVARSSWLVSARREGARIPGANGISAGVYVAVAAFHDARGARALVTRLRHESSRYDGIFSTALTDGPGRIYHPGERGVGTLTTLRRGGWAGWSLDMQRSYTFDDSSESAMEYTRRFVAQRGRFVCAAFLDGRTLTELRHLLPAWPRLVSALRSSA